MRRRRTKGEIKKGKGKWRAAGAPQSKNEGKCAPQARKKNEMPRAAGALPWYKTLFIVKKRTSLYVFLCILFIFYLYLFSSSHLCFDCILFVFCLGMVNEKSKIKMQEKLRKS